MKVGSLVFATDQGLGYLAKDFFDNGVVTDAMMVAHGRREEHPEWFPGCGRLGSLSDKHRTREFCRHQDLMLFFETPFDWELISFCREEKIPTVIMPMHECMPAQIPAQPDLWLCPSELDLRWA